jgi:hypothetical protein
MTIHWCASSLPFKLHPYLTNLLSGALKKVTERTLIVLNNIDCLEFSNKI